jgi:Zn-dependent protease with chaperone function
LSYFGFLRIGEGQTPTVVSIDFDDAGLTIRDQKGRLDYYPYPSLVSKSSQGDRITLGRRLARGFRLDLSGAAAREFRNRTPPPESRFSRLRRWAVRHPKLAALAILIPGIMIERLPGQWVAPLTPSRLAARLDGTLDHFVPAARCRSSEGHAVLNGLVRRLSKAGVPPPTATAVDDWSFLVSARLNGQLLVTRSSLAEIEGEVLAALIAHELAHVENGDLIRAAGRGEGTRFIERIVLGGYPNRMAKLDFSSEEEARADEHAIEMLQAHRISILPAAHFFSRDEQARREESYWAQHHTDVHFGMPRRVAAWLAAARRQAPARPMLNERDADALFNTCWKRQQGTNWKWAA